MTRADLDYSQSLVSEVGSMFALRGVYLIFFQFWLVSVGSKETSLPNVALLGTATQSTTIRDWTASLAISGNRHSSLEDGDCTHTHHTGGPVHWWSLVLPGYYRISLIMVTNRNVLGSRLDNSEILVGNSLENNGNNNPRCAAIPHIPNGVTETYDCKGMVGRVINVKKESTDIGVALTICELEAYGELVPEWPSFSATVMGRSVVVVEKKLCWSDALFYCRDLYWDLLSIRSETEQRAVEEMLKSVSFPLTEHVWLGLRRFLKDDKWFWMSGAAENFTYFETKQYWGDTSPCGAMDTSGRFYWGDRPCHENIHFICLKDSQGDRKRVDFYSSTRV